MDEYIRKKTIDGIHMNRLWTWDDATRMVNFIRGEYARAAKYGLDIPLLRMDMSKAELKRKEDELTSYFIYEMRKPPYRPKTE